MITRRDLGNLLTPRFLRPREGIIKVKEKLKVEKRDFDFIHMFFNKQYILFRIYPEPYLY